MNEILKLGNLEIDPLTFELRSGGQPLPVEPRVFDFVHYLALNQGRVITKAELLTHVWRGCHVTDSALARCASIARRALGDSRWITTVHRRGYRWSGAEPLTCEA